VWDDGNAGKRAKLFILLIGIRNRQTPHQCCGSELIFSDSDPQIIFFGFEFGFRYGFGFIFLNGASNCFHMRSETCTSEKKNFK
jgi:hypothetical protein